jgi:tRNA A-37 threonylcarbamoyl transferase component Bud32
MGTQKLCRDCGAPLAANAPQGLCPACLMKVALATGSAAGDESQRFTPPSVAELAGKFPQLEIIEFIGRGGMGAVYKARQKELDRVVALKVLPPDIGQEATFAERFAREAKALAKLNHPGIVTIYDFGRADGLYFFLMEYVDGVSLRQLLSNSRISPREALAIVPQICDALQFAHDQGFVHRDIKPENILLDRRGRVKVADFGLAKLVGAGAEPNPPAGAASASTELTEAGKIMGTPNYMSPEQRKTPGEVDHRADIYALGVVFYQMLTGELPGKPIEPPSRKILLDVRLDEVVLRALEKEPERRYQQVSALKTEVEMIATTPQAGSRPGGLGGGKGGFRGVLLLGLAALAVIAVMAVLLHGKPRPVALIEKTPTGVAVSTNTAAGTVAGNGGQKEGPDIQGTWEGAVPFAGVGVDKGESSRSRIVLRLFKKEGHYSGSADVIDSGLRDLPVTVDYTYASLRLRVNPQMEFEGVVNADGTELNFDGTVLRRSTTPEAVPERLAEIVIRPRAGSDLQGYWKGTIGTGPDALPLNWKIAEPTNGTYRAELDNPNQGALGQPTRVEYNRPTVKLVLATRNGMFQGEINSDHTELKGSWIQGGESAPASFKRGDYAAEQAQEAFKDYSFKSTNDLQGHWQTAFILNETPVAFPVHLALDIAKLPDGTFSATVASIYHLGNSDPRPTSDFKYSPPNLHMGWKWMNDRFEGELKNGKIVGRWIAGGTEFPVTFERSRQ